MKAKKWIYIFLVPGAILYFTFFIFPLLGVFFYSLTDWSGVGSDFNLIGIENFSNLSNDSVFTTSLTNNLKFLFTVLILQTLFSLIFALLLLKNTKTNTFFRVLFFFPTILSSVSVAFIWTFIYDPNIGLLNPLLGGLGLDNLKQSWLGDESIAIYSIAFVQVWFHTGQVMIIFIAGLQNIPKELYEAAVVDGATPWQKFTKVTWPLLKPATTMVVAYITIQSFKAFDLIFAMTRGGPNYSTEILVTYIYRAAFSSYKFGLASAISIFLLLIVAFIAFLQFKVLNRNKIEY